MLEEVSDPLIQRLRSGCEPFEQIEMLTLDGFPDPELPSRTLKVGETTRNGDHVFLSPRWYPAPVGQVLSSDRPLVWRPLGPNARRWFVGGSGVNFAGRNGDPWKPFASLEEALNRIREPAIGVIVSVSNCEVLYAFDPPGGDLTRAASDNATHEP